MNRKKIILYIFVLASIVVLQSKLIFFQGSANGLKNYDRNQNVFREMRISDSVLKKFQKKYKDDKEKLIHVVTKNMLANRFCISGKKDLISRNSIWNLFMPKEAYEYYFPLYKSVLADLKYFPVGEDVIGKQKVSFENSWGSKRGFGGERTHEGTDLMTSNNEAGYFPVISMTDGIIEKKGWLKLGGYRIGIRSPSGGYFYYAHLDQYAEGLKEGDEVKAGQILGTVGNTGYGEEGTKGKFDVHLHMGIYVVLNEKEVSVNPYFILKSLENNKKTFIRETSNGKYNFKIEDNVL